MTYDRDLRGEPVTNDELPRRREPTMRDVAALAGVSVKTVSRVINDQPGAGSEVTERVREAARSLGYRPNLSASSPAPLRPA